MTLLSIEWYRKRPVLLLLLFHLEKTNNDYMFHDIEYISGNSSLIVFSGYVTAMEDRPYVTASTVVGRPTPPKRNNIASNKHETAQGISQYHSQSPAVDSAVNASSFNFPKQETANNTFKSIRDYIKGELNLSPVPGRPALPKKSSVPKHETGQGICQTPIQSPIVEPNMDASTSSLPRQGSTGSGFTSQDGAGDTDAAVSSISTHLCVVCN